MTFPSSHSFYVTFLSEDDKEEFPFNRSYSFKNRLPRPIRFVGSDWQVGLVRLSIPDAPLAAKDLLDDNETVLYIRWHVRLLNTTDNKYYHYRQETNYVGMHMIQEDLLDTGHNFFNTIVNRYQRDLVHSVEATGKLAEDDGTKLYPSFEWTRDGDLLLNTKNMDYTHQVPQVIFGRKFAFHMKFIKEWTPGRIELGRGLVPILHSDNGSNPTDTSTPGRLPQIFTVDANHLKLSMSCNWLFVNVNAHYRPEKKLAPERTLFVHCDAATSRMVGSKVANVLREISYRADGTTMHFEPQHIHYLPVRSGLMEIIETHVTETDDQQVTFGPGPTLLTLHFKKG